MDAIASFVNLMDNPNHAVIAINPDFTILKTSSETGKYLRMPIESLAGRNLKRIMHPIGFEARQFFSQKLFPQGKQGPCRFYVQLSSASVKDDSGLFLFTYIFPFQGKNKGIAVVILSPEILKAPASHKFLTLFYSLDFPMVMLDGKDRIILYNYHFHEMLNFVDPAHIKYKSILPHLILEDKKDNPFRRIRKTGYLNKRAAPKAAPWKKVLAFNGKTLIPFNGKPLLTDQEGQLAKSGKGFILSGSGAPVFTLNRTFNPSEHDIRLTLDIVPGSSSSTLLLGQPFLNHLRNHAFENGYHLDLEIGKHVTLYLCKRDVVLAAKIIRRNHLRLIVTRMGDYFSVEVDDSRVMEYIDPNPIFEKRPLYFTWFLWEGKVELAHMEMSTRPTAYNPEEIEQRWPRIIAFKATPDKLYKFSAETVSYLKHESALAVRFESLPMLSQRGMKSHSIVLLENARKYIQTHFYRKIDFNNLARQCYQCHKYFIRRFKESYGTSPRAYQTDIRMQEAKALLKSGRMNVREVGETVGFSDPIGFQRLFRKYTGTTPGVFASSPVKAPASGRLIDN